MTSFDPMTRDELLDLAPLDALGLLDDFEAALFDRSFHHAPASVQAEIITLQAEIAAGAVQGASENPRPLLRSKVLLRIAEEVEETAEQLKPLAQIGVGVAAPVIIGGAANVQVNVQAGSGASGSSPIANGGDAHTTASIDPYARDSSSQDDAMRELVAEIRARSAFSLPERATPYWRAAAFFLAAGLLVSVYFLGRTIRTADSIAQLATIRAVSDQLAEQVPGLGAFFARDPSIRGMTAPTPGESLAGTLYVDKGHGRGLLILFRPSATTCRYRLQAIVDEQHAVTREILSFDVKDQIAGMGFELPSDLFACRIELIEITDSGERRVLTTV